jgi:predicted RNA-binding Zn-ribbon protein involved in translation (DUF1610 family)
MAENISCANCGAEIVGEDPAARTPCPQCGSLVRRYEAQLGGGAYRILGSGLTARLIPYPEKLLTTAQGLIATGEFSIAVIVAHMACEISTERALSRTFAAKGIAYLADAIDEFLSGYNLANQRLLKLYNAVTGDQIQKQSFWEDFLASAKLRNDAVHGAKIVNKAEADSSFRATSALVAYLK